MKIKKRKVEVESKVAKAVKVTRVVKVVPPIKAEKTAKKVAVEPDTRKVESISVVIGGKTYNGVKKLSGEGKSTIPPRGVRIQAAFVPYITEDGDVDAMAQAILDADATFHTKEQKYDHKDKAIGMKKAKSRAKSWKRHFKKNLLVLPSTATVSKTAKTEKKAKAA